jgi:hypothetical protein
MQDEKKLTFWGWVTDNPITFVVLLLALLAAVTLMCGYREGFTAILGGLLGWIKGDDKENKRRLEEAMKTADAHAEQVNMLIDQIRGQQLRQDTEVLESAESAKAECDEMDIDELIDVGNAILRGRGAFRGETA